MRKIHEIKGGTPLCSRTVKVHYSPEWQEYRCRLYMNGQAVPEADYHTNDKNDAIATAAAMANIQEQVEWAAPDTYRVTLGSQTVTMRTEQLVDYRNARKACREANQ